ncbi:MAG: hypothetical protein M1541_02510 [Acidobacteria bacterium]|nr:hypothetical protein [Acidobacteriota bacterium]
MNLYNQVGECYPIAAEEWEKLLAVARKNGWKAAGTQPPPRRFTLDPLPSERKPWDGSYARPEGQTVTRRDAEALAAALEHVSGRHARFLRFCRQGGFLICSTEEFGAADQLVRLNRKLLRYAEPVPHRLAS